MRSITFYNLYKWSIYDVCLSYRQFSSHLHGLTGCAPDRDAGSVHPTFAASQVPPTNGVKEWLTMLGG